VNRAGEPGDKADRLHRLERRLERERIARRTAEQIAESRTRDLYEANRDLDRQIMERTAELDQALVVATRASETKSAFLAEMSHQLKTPLNGLMGILELLDHATVDADNAQRLSVAMQSAARLERLVSRLILYSDLDGADLTHTIHRRSVMDIVSDLRDRWVSDCLHAGQLLSVEEITEADILAAHAPLDLALDEVMSNSVTHAGPGAVRIRTRLVERNGSGADHDVELQILDPGPGLPADTAVDADDFSPSDPTRTADRPAGLGLALIDAAVQALGGRWRTLSHGTGGGVAIRLAAAVPAVST
jgi:signal transduction histidine kinase